ncbi:MAG: hypothetical protein LC808_42240 [Actinobacteria bacterium]|nr:hypothetical protein [Actinomycetota bacterium]
MLSVRLAEDGCRDPRGVRAADPHRQTGHSMRVEDPPRALTDQDYRAGPATVDEAALDSAPDVFGLADKLFIAHRVVTLLLKSLPECG